MKIFLSIGIASSLGLITFLPLQAQITIGAPNVFIAQQSSSIFEEEGLAETEKMTEENACYYQLIMNGKRALNREEAVRSFTLAKSRVFRMEDVSESKKQELIQIAENGLKNVDKINFVQNREKYSRDLERGAESFRRKGEEDVARKFERHANRICRGEVKSIYDPMY